MEVSTKMMRLTVIAFGLNSDEVIYRATGAASRTMARSSYGKCIRT